MRGMNKVLLLGNLGAEPECRVLNSGTTVATASLGTAKSRKQQDGSYAEQTEWHKLVFWGKIAETVQQYLHKGSRIYVEGEIRSRQYQDQQGQTRYITEIHVSELLMINGQKQNWQQTQPPMQQWGQPPVQQNWQQTQPPMQQWGQPPVQQNWQQTQPPMQHPVSGTQALDMAVAAQQAALARQNQQAIPQQQFAQPPQNFQQQSQPGFKDDELPF